MRSVLQLSRNCSIRNLAEISEVTASAGYAVLDIGVQGGHERFMMTAGAADLEGRREWESRACTVLPPCGLSLEPRRWVKASTPTRPLSTLTGRDSAVPIIQVLATAARLTAKMDPVYIDTCTELYDEHTSHPSCRVRAPISKNAHRGPLLDWNSLPTRIRHQDLKLAVLFIITTMAHCR